MRLANMPPRVGEYLNSEYYELTNARIVSVNAHPRFSGSWRCECHDQRIWYLPDSAIAITDQPVPVPVES